VYEGFPLSSIKLVIIHIYIYIYIYIYILKKGNRFNLNISNLKDFKGHYAFGMSIVLIIYDYFG
jgi:hypothetical protein